MKQLLLRFSLLVGVLFFLGVSVPAYAQTNRNAACDGASQAAGSSGCAAEPSGSSLPEVIATVVTIFAWIIGIAAVIVIIISGLKFIASRGDPTAVATARRQLVFALVGLFIVVNAGLIARFVLNQSSTGESGSGSGSGTSSRSVEFESVANNLTLAEEDLEIAIESGDEATIESAESRYEQALDEYTAESAEPKNAGRPPRSPDRGPKNTDKDQEKNQDVFRIVSFNTRFDVSSKDTVKDVRRFDNAEIIGLQEIGDDNRAGAIRKEFVDCKNCEFGAYAPRKGASREHMLLWRKDSFKLEDSGTINAAPGDWSWVASMHVNWVKLRSKATERSLYVMSTHFPAHVDVGGHYRPGEADRIRAYGMYMDTVTNFMQSRRSKKVPVFAIGDFNVDFRRDPKVRAPDFPYARMKKIDARSNFEVLGETQNGTHIDAVPGGCTPGNTKGARIIDYVFATNTPGLFFDRHHIVPSTCSDHNAVSVLMKWVR